MLGIQAVELFLREGVWNLQGGQALLGATGVTFAIFTVVSVGLSVLSAYLLQPEAPNNSIQSSDPSTLSARGSFLPYVVGVRRVGPIIAWVGDRRTVNRGSGSGGGLFKNSGGGNRAQVFEESAWHLICVGPALKLKIFKDGKIFATVFDKPSHPSGTPLSFPEMGPSAIGTIFWGESDQQINAFLGDVDRVGVSSGWPFHCYIVWTRVDLGTSTRWPIINYEVEVPVQTPHLGSTRPFGVGKVVLKNITYQVDEVEDLGGGRGAFIVEGAKALVDFPNREGAFYSGDAAANAITSEIVSVLAAAVQPGPGGQLAVRVEIRDPFNASFSTPPLGTLTPGDLLRGGYNGAHIVAQILFNRFPHGLGLDKDLFDMDFLEEVGDRVSNEEITSSLLSQNGEFAVSALGALLQDLGVACGWHAGTGKFRLKVVREPVTPPPSLPSQLVLDPLPKIESIIGTIPVDNAVYVYKDQDLNYKEGTVTITEDGQASLEQTPRARRVFMPTVTTFQSAKNVAERRSQEDLPGGAAVSVISSREARVLFPGQALDVFDVRPRLRILSMAFDVYSGKVRLDCITDFYSSEVSSYDKPTPSSGAPFLNLPQDLDPQGGVFDAPALLSESLEAPSVFMPRIRFDRQTVAANLFISPDDTTFNVVGTSSAIYSGGVLTEELAGDTAEWTLENGPLFDIEGPDIGTALNLTGDEFNWNAGRQIAMLTDGVISEYVYLRNVEPVSATSYRMRGLLRARLASDKLTWPVGTRLYIFDQGNFEEITDILLTPKQDSFFRTQPLGSGSIPLTVIPSVKKTILGGGMAPIKPRTVRPTQWEDSCDFEIDWAVFNRRSKFSGAGFQGAGCAVEQVRGEGEHELRFYTDPGDVLVRTQVVSQPPYFYTLETRIADFGDEPLSFKVEVRSVLNGILSNPETLIMRKV